MDERRPVAWTRLLRYALHGAILVLALGLVALPSLRVVSGTQAALKWMLMASCVVYMVRAKRLRGLSVFMKPGEMATHLRQQPNTREPLFEPMESVAWLVGVFAQVFVAFS